VGAKAVARKVEAAPVLGLCSCLTTSTEWLDRAERELCLVFGDIALRSRPFAFDVSDYYRDELGVRPRRTWLCFSTLWRAERLAHYRATTGAIEERLTVAGRRRVNVDPAYLDHGKLVLASCKEAPAKIYMGDGVWAHACLRYARGTFAAPDHSFPDFRDGRFNTFMLEARGLYKSLLRQAR
jgi:hypothetical protein